MKQFLDKLKNKQDLTFDESKSAFEVLMTGKATDDEIYQNRVNRNSTVIIPYSVFDLCKVAPNNNGKFENGFIVIVKPEDYFDNKGFIKEMKDRGIFLGQNSEISSALDIF